MIDDDMTPEEQALVRAAIERGLLQPSEVEAARGQAAFQGLRTIDVLRARLRHVRPAPGAVAPRPSAAPPTTPPRAAPTPAASTFGASPAPGVAFGAVPVASSGELDATVRFAPAPQPALSPEDATMAGTGDATAYFPPPVATTAGPPAAPIHGTRSAAVSRPGEALGRSSAGDGPAREGWIGDYQVVRELARGGMGVVYVARSQQLGRDVALKMLLDTNAGPEAVERFKLEARAAARLRHPNIVALHHVGEDAGRPYMVMDLVTGGSLKARVDQDGPLPLREAAALVARLADALAYAHQRSILHRDLKPHNVLLDGEGQPVLTDFGLAKDVSGDGVTVTGQVLGTPAYMPPEQAGGDVEVVDRRADVYGLGATLYHLLTGRAPFDGPPMSVITAVLTKEPPRPRSLRPDVDPDLETICLKCMEKEPELRYRTMSELAHDLEAYLEDRPIRARPPTLLGRLGKWRRRNPTLFRAGALGALLLVAGAFAGTAQVLSARADAARREAAAADRERTAARDEARARALDRLAALVGAPLPADAAPGRDEALSARTARAVEAYVAAHRWYDLASADAEAGRALFDAACALGEVNAAARQWLLAVQVFEEARSLGVDDARAAGLAAAARAAREEEREAAQKDRAERTKAIQAALASAAAGELSGVTFQRAAFQLQRALRPDVRSLVLERLDAISEALQEAELELFTEALTEGEAAPDLLRDAQAAIRARPDPATSQDARRAHEHRWYEAAALVARWCERHGVRGPSGAALPPLMAVSLRQTQALGAEVHVARVITAALQQLADDPAVAASLTRYVRSECDMERATRAATALCLAGGAPGAQVAFEAVRRFGGDSALALEVRPLLAHVEGLEGEVEGESYSAYLERAALLAERGDARGALRVADEGLARYPDEPALRLARATALRLLGDHEGAIAECDRVLARRPDDRAALYQRAFARRSARDLQGARDDLERVVQQRPEAADWTLLAAVRFDAGDRAGAEQAFDRALALDPDYLEALTNRALLRKQRRDFEGAAADVERALVLSPRSVQALMLRGDLSSEQGDLQGAEHQYTRALDVIATHPHLWALRARVRLRLGDREGARADAEQALKVDPSGAHDGGDEARQVLAALDADAARPAPGEVTTPPSATDDLQRRYRQLREQGDRRGALAALRELAALLPDDLDCAADLATLALEQREHDLARETSERLIERGAPAQRARGLIVRSRLHLVDRRLDEADRDAEAAVAAAPDDGTAWELAGVVRQLRGDLDAAIERYGRAVSLSPERAGPIYNRGSAYLAGYQQGRAEWRDLARADFERALRLDPRNAGAWGNLGILRAEGGDVDGAIQALERSVELAPRHPMAGRTRALIEELRGRRGR